MCNPAVLIAATVASTAMSAMSAIQQGNAAATAGAANAQIATNNAELRRRQADQIRKKGEIEASEKDKQMKLLVAKQRATFAANGLVIDEGSALDVTTDTVEAGTLDKLTLLHNAELDALNAEADALNFENQASLERFRGESAKRAGRMQAFTTILGGAAKAGGQWYDSFGSTSAAPYQSTLAASGGSSFQSTRMY